MAKPNSILEFPHAKGIVVSGDIHGDFTQLVFKCCVQYEMTDTLIIVAGDCGFGFEKPGSYENIYKRCRDKLSKANNWMVFIRGNHDNPAYFNSQPIKHQRWMTLPDYSVIEACGRTILFIYSKCGKTGNSFMQKTCKTIAFKNTITCQILTIY